jgi:hypothetical protein
VVKRSGAPEPLPVIRTWLGLTIVAALGAACTPGSPSQPGPGGGAGGASGGSGAGGAGGPAASGGAGGGQTGGTGGPAGSGGAGPGGAGGGGSGGGAAAGGAGAAGGGAGGNAGAGGNEGTGGTGGAGSAPDAGAGGSSGPADGPTSPGGCGPAKYCDDFEGFAPGAAPGGSWKAALQRGMLAVDESKAWSGARSVRFTHQGAPAQMFIELRQPVLPMAGNIVYGRLMYYLTKSPTGQYTHFEIVRGGGPLAGGGRAQLNTGAENGKVVVNYEPGDCTKYSKVVFPEKKWSCYQFRFDGTKNDMHVWVDGVSADDVPVAPAGGGCWRAPTAVDTLHVGWESYHGTQPVELWIDDVAVGDQMIPCPAGTASKP